MRLAVLVAAATLLAAPAAAQRADDNAVTEAEDAFGSSVGNENIGLYVPFEVRGFSAIDAGNARLDGLYIDRQADPSRRLVDRSTIRVGISAQGYLLPAPTGIVDYAIRRAGDQRIVSTVFNVGPDATLGAEVDAQLPLVPGRLGIAGGASFFRNQFDQGMKQRQASFAVAPRWRPSDTVEIIPFFSRSWIWDEETPVLIFVSGPHLPPRIPRGRYYGQAWADRNNTSDTYGALGTASAGEWTFRAGLFRSDFRQESSFTDIFRNVDPTGAGDRIIIADSDLRAASTSGEARISRTFVEGPRRHAVHLIARGRDQRTRIGGGDVFNFGRAQIGVQVDYPEPQPRFGPKTRDDIAQWTGAAAYEGRWGDWLELTAGLQKTRYRKTVIAPPPAAPLRSTDNHWLRDVAAAIRPNDSLAFYASHATGLEEAAVAPANAVNRDSEVPALITRQWDAGLRYAFSPTLRLVGGVFDVRKPYYNLDSTGFYRVLGDVRQQGIELSLTGTLAPGLNIVAGAVLLRPRVTGEQVDAGLIGRIPQGQTARLSIVNADYRLPWIEGVSINASMVSVAKRMASSDNRLAVPPRSLFDVGMRYRFTAGESPATLSVRVTNLFNTFGWRTGTSGVFVPTAQRRVSVSLATDF